MLSSWNAPRSPLGGREFRFADRACFTGGHFSRLSKEHILASVLLCDATRVKIRQSYPCNRPWRPIRLSDIEAPTFF
jgi:hypothetical protein